MAGEPGHMGIIIPSDVMVPDVAPEERCLLLQPYDGFPERAVVLQGDGEVDDIPALRGTEIHPEVLPGGDREGGVPVGPERGVV